MALICAQSVADEGGLFAARRGDRRERTHVMIISLIRACRAPLFDARAPWGPAGAARPR